MKKPNLICGNPRRLRSADKHGALESAAIEALAQCRMDQLEACLGECPCFEGVEKDRSEFVGADVSMRDGERLARELDSISTRAPGAGGQIARRGRVALVERLCDGRPAVRENLDARAVTCLRVEQGLKALAARHRRRQQPAYVTRRWHRDTPPAMIRQKTLHVLSPRLYRKRPSLPDSSPLRRRIGREAIQAAISDSIQAVRPPISRPRGKVPARIHPQIVT
jgi:hypothetical protein